MKTNIAEYLTETSQKFSDKKAISYPSGHDRLGRVTYSSVTFSQLENLTNAYACEFKCHGIVKGTKTLMMLRPSLDFIAAVFAVFKVGAVPILIDPGMGRKNMLKCIKSTEPEALIAESEVHWIKYLFPRTFKTINIAFSYGKRPPYGISKLEDIAETLISKPELSFAFETEETRLDETAAILFTTGSTGPPKGVVVTHEIFITQTEIIRETYGAGPNHVDMPAFPLFALFAAALGMPCVIPDMDPTKPAQVDPRKVIEAITNHGVSFSFGSPAFWRTVAKYCVEHKIKLPSLKRVLMAGAPVNDELHTLVKQIMGEGGETMVPYGCTESLPIVNFNGTEMLAETAELTRQGKGFCVGYPIGGMNVRVIKSIDEPIKNWDNSLVLPTGEVGEITIKGSVVTPEYYKKPDATALAKIKDSDGKLIHRMGDVGYFDQKGRLWFCGRKTHRVITKNKTFYTVCCEAIFNNHEKVFRTAIVGVGKGEKRKAVLIVEPFTMPMSESEKQQVTDELLKLGSEHEFTRDINDVLFHESFPVDIRHNAKIFREKLTVWAEKSL